MLAIGIFVLFICAISNFKGKFLYLCLIALIAYAFCFVPHEGDWNTFELVYYGVQTGFYFMPYEPGFSLLMIVCSRLGLPYVWFRFIIFLVCFIPFLAFLEKFPEAQILTLAIYAIFPFGLMMTSIRSAVASSFVLLAFYYLQTNRKKYIFYIIFATLFHYSSIVFLLFLFERKKGTIRYLIVSLLFVIVIIMNSSSEFLYRLISMVTQNAKILQWFTRNEGTLNITGGIVTALLIMCTILFLSKMSSACNSDRAIAVLSESEKYFSVITYRVYKLLFCMLPLILLSNPFMRLAYMVFPMVIITGLNAGRVYASGKKFMVPVNNLILIIVALVWKFYVELPYLKQGSTFFWEWML